MRSERRLRDFAIVLPTVGTLLFLPPYIRIFDTDVLIAGVPLLNIWIFALWFVGIVMTAAIAHRLAKDPECRGPEGESEPVSDSRKTIDRDPKGDGVTNLGSSVDRSPSDGAFTNGREG